MRPKSDRYVFFALLQNTETITLAHKSIVWFSYIWQFSITMSTSLERSFIHKTVGSNINNTRKIACHLLVTCLTVGYIDVNDVIAFGKQASTYIYSGTFLKVIKNTHTHKEIITQTTEHGGKLNKVKDKDTDSANKIKPCERTN